ncbi:MAG: PAS domain S-box protein [Vicinamibacterales bacterium]
MSIPLRVLHLEDSPRDAEIVRHRLETDGLVCTIVGATSKATYEAALQGDPFDLIISDYNLPDYDGVSALNCAMQTQPGVPVILISGTVVDEQAVECLHIGATDYLLKDRLERLVPAMRRAVEEAEERRARQLSDLALSASASRQAAILDSVLDCIVTMDADGMVVEFNAATVRTFGYSRAEAIGRPLADLIVPPRFRDAHRAGLARYVATGEGALIGRLIEISALRADGSEIPVELTITAIGAGTTAVFIGVLRDITARRQADATRARLAAIVESSDDAIIGIDLEGTIRTWNSGAERLYGYSAAKMIGQTWARLVPAAKSAELTTLMHRAALGHAGHAVETQRLREDGSSVAVSLVVSPTTDSTGQVTGVATIARDITARINAEAATRGERDRAQRYLDAPDVMLVAFDVEGRFTLANRYACSVLGWSAEELRGRHWREFVPERTRDALVRTYNDLTAGGHVGAVENPVLTRAGDERLIEWRNTVLRDAADRVIGIFSCGADITERRRMEIALEKTTSDLRERSAALERHGAILIESERRTNYALGAARMGVWEIDLANWRLTWSETMAALFGLTPADAPATADAYFALLHPDDRPLVKASIAQAAGRRTEYDVEFRVVLPDGRVRWLAGRGGMLSDADGRPARLLGVTTDISDRKSLEAQLRQAQKMEAVGQLAGGVAHDFNNLLTVILGFARFVADTLAPEDPRRADLGEVINAGDRATALTNQLLAFSRKQVLQPTRVDLNTLVTDMRGMLGRLIGEQVELVSILAPGVGAVRADRGQLEQVLMNLVVNARDAMPSGGRLSLETANVDLDETAQRDFVVQAGPYVMLAVSDSGTGMTEEVRRRLFEPFFTTKESGKGTGLGLATVYGIVKQSGGYVWVYSEPGHGSSFKVYLPRTDGVDESPHRRAARGAPAKGSETILVVEDEDAVRQLTRRVLESAGYRVLDAARPADAETLFEEHAHAITLLVADVIMPGASGPALFERLARRRPDLRVLYVSGYTDDTIVHQGQLDPGFDLLQKPFSADALTARVRRILDR